jgi:hypothetical protein
MRAKPLKEEVACPGFPWAAAKTQGFRDLSIINIIPEHSMTKTYYVGFDVHKGHYHRLPRASCLILIGLRCMERM